MSSCQYKNAKENVNVHVRNSRVTIVSHPQFRMRREREPSRISYKMVTRISNRKRKESMKVYIQKYVPKSSKLKTMFCGYHRYHFLERYRSSKYMFFSKKCFIRLSLSLCIFRTRTLKHKNLPLFCMIAKGNFVCRKLRQLQIKTYHFSSRIISLSGDVESNPGPRNKYSKSVPFISLTNYICLLEFRLSQLGRTALDAEGGGDCFLGAVSHQLYGNPNNHFYVHSIGIQYLVNHPEQFLESNTGHSWQGYLERMSCQGTWADAIIIQAVANCLNLSIHIAELNPTFSPVTVVEAVNGTNALNIYIGHLAEFHCFHSRKRKNGDKRQQQTKNNCR